MGTRVRRRSVVACCLWAPLALATLLGSASPAHGKSQAVSLREVTTRVSREHLDVRSTFRAELEKQLRSIDLEGIPDRDRLLMSASLVTLDTKETGDRARSTCLVSATLRRERGGALVAIIRGKARAEDARSAVDQNELAVLRAAVHSAVRSIPQAVR